jgi:predicted enzyme related to lactoylglutathione lyase
MVLIHDESGAAIETRTSDESQLEQKGPMNLADATVTQFLIPIDDFERGVSFYRDVLGIPLLFSAPPQMAFFQCGAVRLLVGVTPAGQKAQRGSAIYFSVRDIEGVYASLRDKGVKFKTTPGIADVRMPLFVLTVFYAGLFFILGPTATKEPPA